MRIVLLPVVLALAAPVLAAEADDAAALITVTAARDSGYAVTTTGTATRTDTRLLDVPQSVSVITRNRIDDQALLSIADALRFVPGATSGQGEGHRDQPTLRGTSSTADFFVDGMRDDVQYYRDFYNIERLEILKGPNAMIFGRGGSGGLACGGWRAVARRPRSGFAPWRFPGTSRRTRSKQSRKSCWPRCPAGTRQSPWPPRLRSSAGAKKSTGRPG